MTEARHCPSLAIFHFICQNRNQHVTDGRIPQPPLQPGMVFEPDSA